MARELQIQRDNVQCRSHHQKMMKRFKNIENIISHFLGDNFVKLEEPNEPPQEVKVEEERCQPIQYEPCAKTESEIKM